MTDISTKKISCSRGLFYGSIPLAQGVIGDCDAVL